MLQTIRLQNFRGFDDHTVPFLPTTVIVGKNNAGKSTIVEALRLISLPVAHAQSLSKLRNHVPRTWKISRHTRRARTLAPTLLNLEINTDSVFHRYSDPPARITSSFCSGAKIEIEIYPEEIQAYITATKEQLSHLSILPQVGPLTKEERLLNSDYVRNAISSTLAPLHFRNQVYLLNEYFEAFKNTAENTWQGLRVHEPELIESAGIRSLVLMVTDGDFTAEVAWMGHGLQMWLQTIWFLTRAKQHETVILDEPDVYMHADLQRRLVRYLKTNHKQIIVASHSAEIMAEVEAEELLIVTKHRDRSEFATSLPVAQELLNGLGSVHNLQLARLATAQRYIFVEGDDIAILKRLQNTLYPSSNVPLDTISLPISGWGGWNYAVGTSLFLKETAGSNLCRYCILDSDFHTSEEINSRLQDASKRHINLHIWKKKELENYLLVPSAIRRYIFSQSSTGPTQSALIKQIDRIAEELKEYTLNAIGTELQNTNRSHSFATVSKHAKKRLDSHWISRDLRWSIIPGKDTFSHLSRWSKETYNVSFSTTNIAREIRPDELDAEISTLLGAIERNEPLSDASLTG